MTTVEPSSRSPFWHKQLFGILAAGTFLIFPILSFGFGITFDEWMDSNYGMLVLRFILSLGRDNEYLNFWHGYLYSGFYFSSLGFLYGTLFDTVRNFAYNGLHQDLHLFRFFTFSHFLTSLIGCTAALYTGLVAKELGKWRTACLAFLFMILSPRFLGNSKNDPKDIPKLLKKLEEGADVVSGWKAKRNDPPTKKISSYIFNKSSFCLLFSDLF